MKKTMKLTAGAAVMLLALVMTVMMTACSTGDDGIADGPTPGPTVQPEQPEQPVAKGTTVHVSVGAGIDGSGQTRSAVVTVGGKRTLRFTAAQGTPGQAGYVPADRLFVLGTLVADGDNSKYLAGYLDMVGAPTNDGKSATFAGDLKVYDNDGSESTYTFTAADPLTECSDLQAHLIAGGFYEGFFLVLSNYSLNYKYRNSLTTGDDRVSKLMTKGIAVVSKTYSTAGGFTNFQGDAILNFTLSGLGNNQNYEVSLLCVNNEEEYNSNKENIFDYPLTYETNVRSSGAGVATFAIPIESLDCSDRYVSVAIGGDKFIHLGKITQAKDKVYNVERQWNGSMFVKTYDLTTVSSDLTLRNGAVLTGTLDVTNHPVKISIAAGAKVTLSGVTILGEHSDDYKWAGITCLGDAEITLSGENTVCGFRNSYPGIYVPEGKTLTIGGTGSLTASSNGYGCGIGSGNLFDTNKCGNIHITGGTISATGGGGCAGIGSGGGSCGDIIISGGSVSATGGDWAAGIGSGHQGSCGDITISGATVSATGGTDAAGIGSGKGGHCGDIIISTSASISVSAGNGGPNDVGAGTNGTCSAVMIGDSSSLPAERTDYGDGNDDVDSNEKDGNGTWIWQ